MTITEFCKYHNLDTVQLGHGRMAILNDRRFAEYQEIWKKPELNKLTTEKTEGLCWRVGSRKLWEVV